MSEYRPGDRLRIVLDDVQVQAPVENGYLTVNVGCDEIRIGLDEAGVTVEHCAPAEWPARPGDVWRDSDGVLWFAQHLGGSQMALVPARVRGTLDTALPAYVLEAFGPLTLVHREDEVSES